MVQNKIFRNVIWLVVIVALLGAVIAMIAATRQSDSAAHVQPVNGDLSNIIIVETPTAGDQVKNPIRIIGQARGSWFFEASFPIEVINASGKIIAQSRAAALSDWMTEDFVRFVAEIDLEGIGDQSATLVLRKSNSSVLEENNSELRIPIYLSVY